MHAQAVALECMRGAHRQGRACYLYAFSGPGDVQGIELDTKPDALGKLLSFLAHSFGGGTDVDAPLDLSLKRVAQAAWSQADILLVRARRFSRHLLLCVHVWREAVSFQPSAYVQHTADTP